MQSRKPAGDGLPKWVLPVAIVVGVLVIGLVGWKVYSGSSAGAPGKVVDVRPGMYDLQKEMQKSRQSSPMGDALH
jgi:hypothetical protein